MPVGQRFRGEGARGIARFLSEHQHCDEGFDVQRGKHPGSGRLRITCLGCGASVEYRTGEPGEAALPAVEAALANAGAGTEAEPKPIGMRREEGARPPSPSAAPRRRTAAASHRYEPPRAERRPRRRRWLPAALVSLLVVAGLAMVAIGLLGSGDDDGSTMRAEAPPAQEAAEEPAVVPPDVSQPAPEAAAGPDAKDIRLERRSFGGAFTLGLPAGWGADGSPEEGFSFAPRSGDAEVTVFFEQGTRDAAELAELASDFLAQRHEGARVGAPRRVRFGGGEAEKVRAGYAGGTETAIVLTDAGFSFLVLERVDRGAPPRVRAQAHAVAGSFRPR